jgi:hypothetical protein
VTRHRPKLQVPAHRVPQPPQLFASVCSLTHAFEQQVLPPPHELPSAIVLVNDVVLVAGAHVWHALDGLGAPAG